MGNKLKINGGKIFCQKKLYNTTVKRTIHRIEFHVQQFCAEKKSLYTFIFCLPPIIIIVIQKKKLNNLLKKLHKRM